MEPQWNRRFYIGKALQYAEQSMIEWVSRQGGLPIVLPVLPSDGDIEDLADQVDGLLLSGGSDVSPTFYGEEARRPEWAGDPVRDWFEIRLTRTFLARDKPVLGICRGHQVLNVAMGGSLYQDIFEDGVVTRLHRDPEPYDKLNHEIHIDRPSFLYDIYSVERGRVNTVHHQAIRHLGADLEVMAHSDDGVVEAIRHPHRRYVIGVQWHPEWIDEEQVSEGFLSPRPLMVSFLETAQERPSGAELGARDEREPSTRT